MAGCLMLLYMYLNQWWLTIYIWKYLLSCMLFTKYFHYNIEKGVSTSSILIQRYPNILHNIPNTFRMMTSSNGNIFRVTGHLCGEFTGSPVNSQHKGQWRRALMFSLICVWINGWVNKREADDLRRYRAHYDVIVMENNRSEGARACLLIVFILVISDSIQYKSNNKSS